MFALRLSFYRKRETGYIRACIHGIIQRNETLARTTGLGNASARLALGFEFWFTTLYWKGVRERRASHNPKGRIMRKPREPLLGERVVGRVGGIYVPSHELGQFVGM